MIKRLKTDIIQHIRQYPVLYLIIIFAFLTGIASGSFTAGSMSESQRMGLGGYLQNFFSSINNESINKGAIFWESLWQHLQIAFFLWLSGLFFFGIPFIFILVGIRGFFLGFTVGFLLSHYGFGGFMFSILCILPQTLIFVPCIIGIGVLSLEYSLKKYKNRKLSYSREQRLKNMTPYSFKILVLFLPIILASFIEAFITPVFFGLFRMVFA